MRRVRSLIGTLARTPSSAHVRFDAEIPDGLSISIDRTTLLKCLAICSKRRSARRLLVFIKASQQTFGPSITVEDDGKGIAPAEQRVVERGVRFDQRPNGAGLGLAIVQDVLEPYGVLRSAPPNASAGSRHQLRP